ncbi:MAG: hypothetical protein ACTSVI_00885 [Promethearchaeota archaeon]
MNGYVFFSYFFFSLFIHLVETMFVASVEVQISRSIGFGEKRMILPFDVYIDDN